MNRDPLRVGSPSQIVKQPDPPSAILCSASQWLTECHCLPNDHAQRDCGPDVKLCVDEEGEQASGRAEWTRISQVQARARGRRERSTALTRLPERSFSQSRSSLRRPRSGPAADRTCRTRASTPAQSPGRCAPRSGTAPSYRPAFHPAAEQSREMKEDNQ